MPLRHTDVRSLLDLRVLFDRDFYLAKYPDVAEVGMNPLRHYWKHGIKEGRKPNALFEPRYCPLDVWDFLRSRGATTPDPHPLFDCAAYVREAVGAADANPLIHYLRRATQSLDIGDLHLDVMDARLAIEFSSRPRTRGPAHVWEDESGRTRFSCEARHTGFLRTLRYDQLRAQVNG